MPGCINPFGKGYEELRLPDNAFIAGMASSEVLADAAGAIEESLQHPIGCDSLESIARGKKARKADADAVIVISDNTRPVPYKGPEGILMPVIRTLMGAGYAVDDITILVATGMHRPMSDDELHAILDPEVYELGVKIINHEPKNPERLTYMGTTGRGTRAMIDTIYAKADLKILTGLVESHFMAGASGGRKAICPGVIGEESTYVFHGPELMADERSRDLNIEGNPVHEESLAVARLAGADFIVNVTLDRMFHVTGVFSGELEAAHLAAVEHLRGEVEVTIPGKADIVITHAGFVGINHYQMAKSGVASLGALKEDGYLVCIGNATDQGHVIGSANYRTTLALLKLVGPDAFDRLLRSPDWTFLPEQWQVQQWAKVFRRIPQDHYYLYAPQITHGYYQLLPGNDIRELLVEGEDENSRDIYSVAIEKAIEDIEKRTGKSREEMKIVYLSDGPYGIPVVR